MTNAPSALPTGQRLWLVLTQVALLLPFVTARGCGNATLTDYTGIDLYLMESNGALLVLLLIVIAPLFAFPYPGQPIGRALASLGLRAWLAGAGLLLAVTAPSFVLLFDHLTYRAGWFVHVGGWAALYLAYFVGSIVVFARGGGAVPHGRIAPAIAALLTAPVLAVLVKRLHDEPTPSDILLALVIGYGMSLPLVLAGLGLAREQADGAVTGEPVRRSVWVPWWGLVLVTIGMHVLGALAE